MAMVREVTFNVRFREKHTTPAGEPCDGVARLGVSLRTFLSAAQSDDPLSEFPEVSCYECGTKLDISLDEWAREAESAVRSLREEVHDLARVALILREEVLVEELKFPSDDPHGRILGRHFVKEAMLRATDIARAEHGFDLARVIG